MEFLLLMGFSLCFWNFIVFDENPFGCFPKTDFSKFFYGSFHEIIANLLSFFVEMLDFTLYFNLGK